MSNPVLTLRVTAELPPEEWQITERTAEIGRLPTCTVVLPHRSVSREHAHISREGDEFTVEDLGSKNGTWLNDQQVRGPVPLNNGDTLLIGDIPLQVVVSGVPEVVRASPVPPKPTPGPPTTLTPPPLPHGVAAGPSTVMVGLEDVLQAPPPVQPRRPRAWDETPSSHQAVVPPPPLPPVPLPPTPTPTPMPHQPAPLDIADFDPPTVLAPPPTDLPPPLPVPLPRTPEPLPQPGAVPIPLELEPVQLSDTEPATATLARVSVVAESLAAAMRTLSGDLATALWIFDHAGGEAAAQAFIDHVNAAYLHPEDNARELDAIVEQAPTVARLLQAAMLLVRGLSASPGNVEAADGRRDEAQSDASELEPIARR